MEAGPLIMGFGAYGYRKYGKIMFLLVSVHGVGTM